MAKVDSKRVIEVVELILGTSDRIKVSRDDAFLVEIVDQIDKSRVRLDLSMAGISVAIPKNGPTVTFSRIGAAIGSSDPDEPEVKVPASKPKSRPKPKRHQHTYKPPRLAKDIMDALLDEASHVLWFKGPTGTGKTVLAHYLANELGYELFQLNCFPGMTEEDFFGEKTLDIDEESKQNHLAFEDGKVVQAMQAGLDEDGNETGKPGLLFIDEAGAMPTNSIALNRLMESDDPRRTIVLNRDGGRVVRSHSKFRIILAANTAGRGATDMSEALYTAQMDALDISLLNRVTFTFRFGYDRSVEKHILMEKVGDDRVVSEVLKFRDAIRDNIRAGKLSTPFSTRSIVDIADANRVYGDLAKAIYYTTFEKLLPEERPVYNEIAVAQLGEDILKKFVEADIDYM